MFNLGARLKELRKAKGVTQKQMAQEIGASERGIQQYELGERKPTYDMLITLADYFDVSIDYLTNRQSNNELSILLGQNVRRLRQSMELSQEELAFRAEMTVSYLSQIEKGCDSVTIDSLFRICKALDVSFEDLFRVQ